MDESEAYWAGLIVAIIMLGSGFSMLLIPAFTGYGAIILSLGVMTMILVLMTKALIAQIQKWMNYNARIEETVSTILALRTKETQTSPPQNPPQTKDEPSKTKAEEEIPVAAT